MIGAGQSHVGSSIAGAVSKCSEAAAGLNVQQFTPGQSSVEGSARRRVLGDGATKTGRA